MGFFLNSTTDDVKTTRTYRKTANFVVKKNTIMKEKTPCTHILVLLLQWYTCFIYRPYSDHILCYNLNEKKGQARNKYVYSRLFR